MSWTVDFDNKYIYYDVEKWLFSLDENFDAEFVDEAELTLRNVLRLLSQFDIVPYYDFSDGDPTIWMRNK